MLNTRNRHLMFEEQRTTAVKTHLDTGLNREIIIKVKYSKMNERESGGVHKTQIQRNQQRCTGEPEDQYPQYVYPASLDLWFGNPGPDTHM